MKEHIGDYWFSIRVIDRSSGFGMVKKDKTYFFKSLKALKRAINRAFEEFGYGAHYKVSQKEAKDGDKTG